MAISPRDVLAKNRADAARISTTVGSKKLETALRSAHAELLAKLAKSKPGTFGEAQLKTTIAQIRDVLDSTVIPGIKEATLDASATAADYAAGGVVEYLERAELEFRGTGTTPLALRESSVLNAAKEGARSTVLRRLVSGGTDAPNADPIASKAKVGILQRYGMNTIEKFENTLQRGMLARKSMIEMRDDLISDSPFLQDAPVSWAQRIVRTEVMGAYSRAGHESMRQVSEDLDDMIRILSATFDNRTAADSYAVHGQMRRMNEPFDTWFGPIMAPPARPNDREIIVPHRLSWGSPPPYLKPKDPSQVAARWIAEGRKKAMPEIPLISTIAPSEFGSG